MRALLICWNSPTAPSAPAMYGLALLIYLFSMGPAQYYIYDTCAYRNDRLAGTIYTETPDPYGRAEPRVKCALYQPILWACTQSTVVYDITDAWLRVWGSRIGHIADGQSKAIILAGYVENYTYQFGNENAPRMSMRSGLVLEPSLQLNGDLNFPGLEWCPYPLFHQSPWDTEWSQEKADYYMDRHNIFAEQEKTLNEMKRRMNTLWDAMFEKEELEQFRKDPITATDFTGQRLPLNPWSTQPEITPPFKITTTSLLIESLKEEWQRRENRR